MAISIYNYPQVLHLTVGNIMPNCQRTGVNMIVSQHYTNSAMKLFRNTDQRVDLLLKDWDRRPIKFEEYQHVWIKIYDGTREIAEKEAVLLNWDKGHYAVDFTTTDTASFQLGQFTYCILVKDIDADGSTVLATRMLYTNQDYGAHSPLTVIEGPLPLQPEAEVVDVPTTILSDYYATSALKGALQVTNPMGVHSVALVLNNYTGIVTVEASPDLDIPATDQDWVSARSVTYTAETSTQHIGFTGNYNWVRFKFNSIIGLTSISYRNV